MRLMPEPSESKAQLTAAEDFILFERHKKHNGPVMGHQVMVQPEILVMSCVLLDLPHHRPGEAQ